MAENGRRLPKNMQPDPEAIWQLPKAFQAGGKLDILTPIAQADEIATQLQDKLVTDLRRQMGSAQGQVAAIQQAAKEGINTQLQPSLDTLTKLAEQPLGAITRGLGEAMEYSAGVGVTPQGNFQGMADIGVAGSANSFLPNYGVEREVKRGDFGSKADFLQAIRDGRIVERNSALGDRRYVYSRTGSTRSIKDRKSASSPVSQTTANSSNRRRSNITSQVGKLASQISAIANQNQQTSLQLATNAAGFNPFGQVNQSPAELDYLSGLQRPVNQGQGFDPNAVDGLPDALQALGGQGNPPQGNQGQPGLPQCVLIVGPGDSEPMLVHWPLAAPLPAGSQIVAGPSSELCTLLPAAPQALGSVNLAPPGERPIITQTGAGFGGGAALPSGPTGPYQDYLGSQTTANCPDENACTFDIRRTKAASPQGGFVGQGSSSEGADDSTTGRANSTTWQSFSSISGEGTYVVPPGQAKRNTFDCKLAEGPTKACVEQVANSVSGITPSEGKSESGKEYERTLGALVTQDFCDGYKAATLAPGDIEGKSLTQILRLADDNKEPTWASKPGLTSSVFGSIVYGFARGVNFWIDRVGFLPVHMATNDVCTDIRLYPIYIAKFVYGFAARWLGFIPTAPSVRLEQAENLVCTPSLPSAENAIEGKLTNQITDAEYKCWTEASGYPKELWDKMLAARQTRLQAEQLTTLMRRGDIGHEEYNARLRELGWLNPKAADEIEILTRQYPGMQDIVRFMVRDVVDPNIVNTFGLDTDFHKKFQGELVDWARQQGIPVEVAKFFWRAHWDIPSPTQLYELYHRLRHDPKYGGPAAFKDMIKTALEQQDILPFWVDALLDISFRPLTRVDVRRAYGLGVLNDNDVLQAYRDSGYSDTNATTLADFARKDRERSWGSLSIIKKAIAGQVSDQAVSQWSNRKGMPVEFDQWYPSYVSEQIQYNRAKACLNNIKKRYLRGEIDDTQVPIELDKVGIEHNWTTEIAVGWQCEKASKSKIIPASQLCKLYSQKIITLQQFQDSLHNLGYTAADALKLLGSCVQGLEVGERKKLEQKAKAEAALQEKLRKQQEREAKNADKIKAAMQKRLAALNKARETRADAIVAAAEKLAKSTGESMVATMQQVKSLVKRLQSERGMSEDNAIAQMQVAVDAAKKGEPADLWTLAFQVPLPTFDTV